MPKIKHKRMFSRAENVADFSPIKWIFPHSDRQSGIEKAKFPVFRYF
jgi:hypothetical protein